MKFGVIIIVGALMLTILLGSLAVDHESVMSTRYDKVADLGPIVSYTEISEVVQYNPAQNVTGWQNAGYTYQLTPSVYSITEYGTTTPGTTSAMSSYGGAYFDTDAAYGFPGMDVSWYVVWDDSTRPSNGGLPSKPGWEPREDGHMIGGYSSSDSYTSPGMKREAVATVKIIKADGTVLTATDSNPLWWQPLEYIAIHDAWTTGTIISISSDVAVVDSLTLEGDYLESINGNYERRSWATQTVDLGIASATDYWWDTSSRAFFPIVGEDPQGNPIYSGIRTSLAWWGTDMTATLTYEAYTPGDVHFVKPYTDVSISPGEVATWSNGYDNDAVQIIVDPSARISVNPTTPITWQVSLPLAASGYSKVLITLGPDSYWQGITSYNGPSQYDAMPYRYPLAVNPGTIQSLAVTNSNTAAIMNTWMPADPLSRLWGDPTISPYTYFPDLYGGAGARIVIASVLKTGTSLTIGGTAFPTSDGRIMLGDSWQDLNGLSIDYGGDGKITMLAQNGTAYEVGTWADDDAASTSISGAGTWYFTPSIYDATVVSKDVSILQLGQSSSAEWMGFAFIGICVMGSVLVIATGNQMDLWDWVAMILAIGLDLVLIL